MVVASLVSISMCLHLPVDDLLSHEFSIIDEATSSQCVDEDLGPVQLPRVLRGTVVLRESVVVVVPSLSHSGDRSPHGLNRRNPGVVGLEAKVVSSAVNEPGGMEQEAIPQKTAGVESNEG